MAKYIPELASKLQPIRNLLKKKTTWGWTDSCQQAFEETKKAISDIRALKHYDAKAKTILTTDASHQGLGATLWQTEIDGRHPVAFASRFLSKSEKNYAKNELQLLAIRWAIEHFKYYLLSREFEVETDHKALVPIFNKDKLEKQYSSRLIRWRQRLLPYNFTVRYRPGRTMGITDYLSRNPEGAAPPDQWKEEETVVIGIISELNREKDRTLYPEIEREVRMSFLMKGKKAMCEQKKAIVNQIVEKKAKGEATKPRDAVKLARALNSMNEQPIKTEKRQRVSKSKHQNKSNADQRSLNHKLSLHSSSVFRSISKIKSVNMVNNSPSNSASNSNYHRINSRPIQGGDTDSVVEASRQDLVHEIKMTESEFFTSQKEEPARVHGRPV